MSYHPTHQPYMTRDNNNSEWYFKIISLREEMAQIEDEIALCNDENNIQLLREKFYWKLKFWKMMMNIMKMMKKMKNLKKKYKIKNLYLIPFYISNADFYIV